MTESMSDDQKGFRGFMINSLLFAFVALFFVFVGRLMMFLGVYGLTFIFPSLADMLFEEKLTHIMNIGSVAIGGLLFGMTANETKRKYRETLKVKETRIRSLEKKLDDQRTEIESLKKRLELPPPLKAK